jgi:hypothetical protein
VKRGVWQALPVATPEPTRARSLPTGPSMAVLRRARDVALSVPIALVVVVAAAIMLRAVVWLAYDPAFLNMPDTSAYLFMAAGELFNDPIRTAGYPMVMRVLHGVSDDVDLIVAIQHLVGIASGVLTYLTVRRIGAPVWAAVIGAAAILLSLDQIALEQTLLSETQFTFLLVAALYCGVRALGDPRELVGPLTSRHLWLVATGVLFALTAWTRGLGAPLVPLVAIFFALAIPGPVWPRIGRGALAGGAGMAVLLVYFSLNSAATGTFGMAQSSGWAIYARTAPFADCSQFTPPSGTEKLCQSVPAEQRPGPDYYTWRRQSPARREIGYPPAGDDSLRSFGVRAILAQPRAYVSAVSRDFMRFFFPSINRDQFLAGVDYDYLEIDRRDRAIERDIASKLAAYYSADGQNVDEDVLETLTEFQQVLRVHPVLMLQALVLGALGIWFGSGRVRWALVLLLGTSLVLLAIPSAIGTYNARYAIPLGGPLLAAGATGLWVLFGRIRAGGRARGAERPVAPGAG